jgi:hypothetical protein
MLSLELLKTGHQQTSPGISFDFPSWNFTFPGNLVRNIQDPSVTYSDKLRNRDGREMTEKFHEMASATEAPPKTCFLLDDDGEFPPVAFAAS